MLEHKDHFHGSDLEKIEALYGIRKENIISFSANVNPLGLSDGLKAYLAQHLDVITSYPDRDYTRLKQSIADYCGTIPGHIVVGNGSTELISLFIQLLAPKKALILGPTYSEYEREITLGGGQCLYAVLDEERDFLPEPEQILKKLDATYDMLVICNPNNPTSTALTAVQMRPILDACSQLGILVMVDETYVEFAPEPSRITAIPLTDRYDNLVILRGVSKFFASPGLRLGYAVCSSSALLSDLNQRKNPWTINSLAEAAGCFMFSDKDYQNATRSLISRERQRVVHRLRSVCGLKVYEPNANFVLVRILSSGMTADTLFDCCIRKHLMIRNCASFPTLDNRFFRICFMHPDANDMLLDCITESML